MDRWFLEQPHNLKIDATGLHFTPSSSDSYTNLLQKIPVEEFSVLNGKTITVSALTSDGKLLYDSGTWTPESGPVVRFDNFEFSSAAFVDAQSYQLGRLYVHAGKSADVLAVKVELGSTQTLAHKENGVWVLNEIPDFGEQLRRCRDYCRKIKYASYTGYAMGVAMSANFVRIPIFFEDMRTTPTVDLSSASGLFLTGAEGDVFGVSFTLAWSAPNCIVVDATKTGAFISGQNYFLRNDATSFILASADL